MEVQHQGVHELNIGSFPHNLEHFPARAPATRASPELVVRSDPLWCVRAAQTHHKLPKRTTSSEGKDGGPDQVTVKVQLYVSPLASRVPSKGQ